MEKTNNPQLVICSAGGLYKVLYDGKYVLCRKLYRDEVLRDGDLCHENYYVEKIYSTECAGDRAGLWPGACTYYRPIKQKKEKAVPKYKYEYNEKRILNGLYPGYISSLDAKLCEEEFGKYCIWYFKTKQQHNNDLETFDAMVQDEKFLWLDWLAENTDMVIRTKVEEKFDVKSVRIEKDGHGRLDIMIVESVGRERYIASIGEDGYLVLNDYVGANTNLKRNNKGEVVVKDSNGKILNP